MKSIPVTNAIPFLVIWFAFLNGRGEGHDILTCGININVSFTFFFWHHPLVREHGDFVFDLEKAVCLPMAEGWLRNNFNFKEYVERGLDKDCLGLF